MGYSVSRPTRVQVLIISQWRSGSSVHICLMALPILTFTFFPLFIYILSNSGKTFQFSLFCILSRTHLFFTKRLVFVNKTVVASYPYSGTCKILPYLWVYLQITQSDTNGSICYPFNLIFSDLSNNLTAPYIYHTYAIATSTEVEDLLLALKKFIKTIC